jgi:hypothetical protein
MTNPKYIKTKELVNGGSIATSTGETFVKDVSGTPDLFFAETTTATATSGSATLNTRKGAITTESLTTASGASYTLTITNSKIKTTSIVMASVCLEGSTAGKPVVGDVFASDGSVSIKIHNIHASNAFNGTLQVNFIAF